MDILDTGTDGQGRFLDSTNYGVNFFKDTAHDLEAPKSRVSEADRLESDEEDFSGVGMRVSFKARGCINLYLH